MAPRGAKARGVHVVLGSDSLLADRAVEALLQAAVGDDRSEGLRRLRGDETTWSRVLEACRTGSLFAERRAVVVRNAEALKGPEEPLAEYLDEPSPGVTLVIVAGKADKRRSVWRLLAERAEVHSAEPLKGQALRAHVAEELRRRKVALLDDGFEELLERVGQDLRRLVGEIDKLGAFGEGRPLSADDVGQVLGQGLAPPLYRLGDAFAARRTSEALGLMERILEEGEAPPRILATLHRALRQVRGARGLVQARARNDEIASRLGVPPFKVRDLLEASRGWTEGELRGAFLALGNADRRLKSSVDGGVALSAAIVGACGARGKPGAAPGGRPRR